MPFKLGPLELVLILVIVLVIFGAGKLPQLFRSVSSSFRSFRDGQNDNEEEEIEEIHPRPKTKKTTHKEA